MSANLPSQLELPGYSRPNEPSTGLFRPIHYIGSKLRILDSILDAVEAVAPGCGPICDLFSGSGTVAMALAQHRRVVAVDIQEYSRVICSALLCQSAVSDDTCRQTLGDAIERSKPIRAALAPLIGHETSCFRATTEGRLAPLCDLVEQGSIVGHQMAPGSVTDPSLASAIRAATYNLAQLGLQNSVDTLVTRHFGGVYFSYSQAVELDALVSSASHLGAPHHDLFLAAALSTASSVVNTVGKHFAQPIRPRGSDGQPKRHVVSKIEKDRVRPIFSAYEDWLNAYRAFRSADAANVVIRGDYASTLQSYRGELAAVYADPPYTRDHYSRFYHVLETMCLRDNPGVSMMRLRGENRVSRGLYRIDRHQSPFCIRSQAPKAFAELFKSVQLHRVPLVLSYSPDTQYEGARPRVMTIDAIRQLALKFFSTVDVQSASSISHSKLNSAEKILGRSADAERLLICRP